jgi:hypothetical protein
LARLVLSECNGAVISEPAEPTEGPSRVPEATEATANMQAAVTYRSPPSNDEPMPLVVRWEQLTAPRNRFESPERARQALAYVRWAALGQPVPRPDGFDPKAIVVRAFDWTRPEQASSAEIARALFLSPTDLPSDVIEDDAGWHLILVRQRRPEQNQPLEANPVSIGGSRADRQPLDYGSAYLDRKLFTETPPGPGGNLTRPTRISQPDNTSEGMPVPLTIDRPRRLPGTGVFPSLPTPQQHAIDVVVERDADGGILRVNAIQPLEAWHDAPAE